MCNGGELLLSLKLSALFFGLNVSSSRVELNIAVIE
jgi:hypothetical protein